MTDHLPMQTSRTQRNLCLRFLDLIFAEAIQTRGGSLRDHVGRLAFRDCQQRDGSGVASRAPASSGNALLNRSKIGSQIHGLKLSGSLERTILIPKPIESGKVNPWPRN